MQKRGMQIWIAPRCPDCLAGLPENYTASIRTGSFLRGPVLRGTWQELQRAGQIP